MAFAFLFIQKQPKDCEMINITTKKTLIVINYLARSHTFDFPE